MYDNATSYNHKVGRLIAYHHDLFSQIDDQYEKGQKGEVQAKESTLAIIIELMDKNMNYAIDINHEWMGYDVARQNEMNGLSDEDRKEAYLAKSYSIIMGYMQPEELFNISNFKCWDCGAWIDKDEVDVDSSWCFNCKVERN